MTQSVLLQHHHAAESLRSKLVPVSPVTDDACGMDVDARYLMYICQEMRLLRARVAGIELYHSALYLRRQVLSMKNTLPALPTLEDFSQTGSTVPIALHNFLSWVLRGDVDDQGGISLERKVDVCDERRTGT